MELVAAQEVRKSPSPLPSEESYTEERFGPCPSRVVLSPSTAAIGALLPVGGGSAPSVNAYVQVANRNTSRLSTSRPTPEPIRSTNSGKVWQTMPTVLVVEDDPDIAMGLQDLLEFEGFQVDRAATCRHAFSSIEQRAYNAVLLDLGLPDGDGLTVLEKLNVSHPSLPVIILTASNRDLGSVQAYARLTKPWERRELCGILHRAIGTALS